MDKADVNCAIALLFLLGAVAGIGAWNLAVFLINHVALGLH